jgi:hypothetical protein
MLATWTGRQDLSLGIAFKMGRRPGGAANQENDRVQRRLMSLILLSGRNLGFHL